MRRKVRRPVLSANGGSVPASDAMRTMSMWKDPMQCFNVSPRDIGL